MYIMDSRGKTIHNTEFFERIGIMEYEESVMIYGAVSANVKTIAMGRYADMEEGKLALSELFGALSGGQQYFVMPDSVLHFQEREIHDARVKRKGGS